MAHNAKPTLSANEASNRNGSPASVFVVIVAQPAIVARKFVAPRKRVGDNGKLPNPATLKIEYDRLMAKKNSLVAAYKSLKRQAREYGVVKSNVDSILDPSAERMRGKERGVEL